MKNFEEEYVRLVDDETRDGPDRVLRREMEDRGLGVGALHADRRFLRVLARGARRREIEHPEFFNEGILDRIRREDAVGERADRRGGAGLPVWLRLAFGGALCLMVAAAMTLVLRPYDRSSEVGLTTRILDVREFRDGVTATPLATSGNHYAVVWVSGLDYLPEERVVQ